jgi:hypothetical protein
MNVRSSIAVTHSMALTTPALLQGIDLHYETENRLVWNEQGRRNEERELVYEISWIPELSTWRRFCGHNGANKHRSR